MNTTAARERRRARKVRWGTRVGSIAMRLLARTWRSRTVNREASQRLRDAARPVIFCLWHGDMLALLWHFRREGVVVLVSEHSDGEIIARIAESLGYGTVRGSTFRGADRALLHLSRAIEGGASIAITPDGPRGPARRFTPGALVVAQRTGAPIIPVRVAVDRAWRLRSWDRFAIPKPFARITIVMGDPVWVEAPSARAAAEQGARFEALMEATGKRGERIDG